MTYIVSGGALNSTHSLTLDFYCVCVYARKTVFLLGRFVCDFPVNCQLKALLHQHRHKILDLLRP